MGVHGMFGLGWEGRVRRPVQRQLGELRGVRKVSAANLHGGAWHVWAGRGGAGSFGGRTTT